MEYEKEINRIYWMITILGVAIAGNWIYLAQ